MKLIEKIVGTGLILVALIAVIKVGHLDRDATPSDTQGAVNVAMTNTLGPCVIKPVISKASDGRRGADVTMNVTTTQAGTTTLYVYGDHNKGVRSDWNGGSGSFTWHTNLPESTVKGVKYLSGIINVNGRVTSCKVVH